MAGPTPEDLKQGVPPTANVVKRVAAPGGGEYLLDANGGVYAIGGANYGGSYFDQNYLDQKHNTGAQNFTDLVLNPMGGYKIISEQSPVGYDFSGEYQRRYGQTQAPPGAPAAPAPNTLYSDPGFLAFLRSSDLGLETAASKVAQQQDALRRALGMSTTQLQDQGGQERQGIANSFESRGVFRSGMNAVKQAEQEQRQAQAISANQAQTAGQVADLSASLADKVAEQQRLASEKGYGVAGEQELNKLQEGLRAKYPSAYGGKA